MGKHNQRVKICKSPCAPAHPRPSAKSRNHGEANGRAKLTHRDVENLRQLVDGGMSQDKAAKKLGISKGHASRIVNYLAW